MTANRRTFLKGGACTLAAASLPTPAQKAADVVSISVDTRAVARVLPHIWEECVGSDRAAITLRESWRHDLERGHAEAGFKRVRFHGIFNDELGVDAPSILNHNKPDAPNFQNIDQVYDGLLARGVTPLVELSFMPKQLASADRKFGFYEGNISPPAAIDSWVGFIHAFVTHLVDRYGVGALQTWLFEVWNEPNLPFFWTGTQQQYFELYKATAVAIKSIDPRLQVGGPATARAEWLPEFAAYCEQNNAPIDFFSTHVYAGDDQKILFGEGTHYVPADVIPQAVSRARARIDATTLRGKPLWLSEWSSDSPAMIAQVVAACLPSVQAMSHWVLSATYEELGVADYVFKEGYMGWAMMTHGIALPAFNTYKLLHALGTERLASQGPALASRRADRSVAALVWNLAQVAQPSGIPDQGHVRSVQGNAMRYQVEFAGARGGQRVQLRYVDQVRGSPMPAWREFGSPQYPTADQLQRIDARAEISPPQQLKLDAERRLILDLPPEGVALIELI
jgi:xylan 1,4-beta-xylosidase